jgi:hypothetical protein
MPPNPGEVLAAILSGTWLGRLLTVKGVDEADWLWGAQLPMERVSRANITLPWARPSRVSIRTGKDHTMDDARKVYKGYGSTQGPTGADGTSSLSGMVDDGNGDGVAPVQFADNGYDYWAVPC